MKTIFSSIGYVIFFFLLTGCDPASNGGSKQTAEPQEVKPGPITLVIHGGAGTIERKNMSAEMEAAYTAKLSEALNAGYAVLQEGGKAEEAVIQAITLLEDSPLFNAGKGAVFTAEGVNELDASIMLGKDLNAGAVAGVKTVKNPIRAALAVMQNSPHVMLSGTGAEAFATEQGLELVDNEYFRVTRRYNQWLKANGREDEIVTEESKEMSYIDLSHEKHGTVGAVALDSEGNLAAGTSTGGMTNKKWGRIGDSPIISAGTYADNASCGVSATGHGEFFIRAAVAYDIAAQMKYGKLTLQNAAQNTIHEKLGNMGGTGGIISLDRQGNVVMEFNTSGMYRGYINEEGNPQVAIYQD